MSIIEYEVNERVAVITLNRPERRNAQNAQLLKDLDAAFDRAVAEKEVRVIVLKAAGDHLFAGAFALLAATGSHERLTALADASLALARGEALQRLQRNDPDTPVEAYLERCALKTGSLFEAACVLGGGSAEFGRLLGIAFQIVDDVLDYSAREALLGKTVGDDFREGKMTLPVVYAIGRGSDSERAFWRRTMEDMDHREGDLDQATGLIERHDGFTAAIALARKHGGLALDALARLPFRPMRGVLASLVEFCISREF